MKRITPADRQAAANKANAMRNAAVPSAILSIPATQIGPGSVPDYFGVYPNYANSPLPIFANVVITGDGTGATAVATVDPSTGKITAIDMVNGGQNYTYATVTIQGNNQSGGGTTPPPGGTRPPRLRSTGGSTQATAASADFIESDAQIGNNLVGAIRPRPGGGGGGSSIQATATATVSSGQVTAITITNPGSGYNKPIAGTGIRKFVDNLPSLQTADPDTTTFPGCDYYEIEMREYSQMMHSDLPPTTLRGYVQVRNGSDVKPISYLGPLIIAERDRPVRIKFTNKLPTGTGGDLFIPVDTTYMGAGIGPDNSHFYTQNRASTHLHGGATPWISDGTPHQWITPNGENTPYKEGTSKRNVPDMWFDSANNYAVIPGASLTPPAGFSNATNDPGQGSVTFYYTNQQSARLMFYHDHAYGITRLNVYAGMAAGYLITDPTEQTMIKGGSIDYTIPGQTGFTTKTFKANTLPGIGIPLVIQDRTFVPDNTRPFKNLVGVFNSQLAAQDPTWDWGSGNTAPGLNGNGDLWFPHVYMPNQNPEDISGANAMGRWDYGPWFWPPFTNLKYGPIPNPYSGQPGEPQFIPGTPDAQTVNGRTLSPSGVPESFLDTPLINGIAYPHLEVPAGPVRFRILNAANDRFWNLSLWVANPSVTTADGRTNTEVKMVPFNGTQNTITPFPTSWYTSGNPFSLDDRVGGVPDPTTRGPAMIQIGTEGGFLPAPAVIYNQPVNYNYNRRDIVVLNVLQKALFIGPAERADIIVDFSQFAGKTLILYNDAPAPVPAGDPRLDNFTGDPDQTDTGGPPTTIPGYGPNTRTIMQIHVAGSGGTGTPDYVNPTLLSNLQAALPAAFAASQEPIIVPQQAYDTVYGTTTVDKAGKNFATIQTTQMTFTPIGQTELTMDMWPKSIIEDFQMDYGRMNAILGVEIAHTNITNQTSILQSYIDPPTEIIRLTAATNNPPIGEAADGTQIWKITHNGVDTHAMHFHLFHVQLINRVGWDGAIRKPDPNELGWKDTVRMNPLEDVIVALRPKTLELPFQVPNSVRLLDPNKIEGYDLGFTNVDPNGNPVTVTNQYVNFGWEYVWHCHLLGHEENDMMRPLAIASPPEEPTNLTIDLSGTNSTNALLNWNDNSINETSFTVQRAGDSAFTQISKTVYLDPDTTSYEDTEVPFDTNLTYYYRVYASNTVGLKLGGYSQITADSGYSNAAAINPPAPPSAPSGLTAEVQAGPQVLLTWTDNSSNETGFTIQRRVNGGSFSTLTSTIPANTVTYTDTSVTADNIYEYQVAAVNAGGPSTYSNPASATVGTPTAPSNLTAVVQAGPQVLLTWTDNARTETGFTIMRSLNGGGFTTLTSSVPPSTGTGGTVTYTDTDVAANNTYDYKVVADNATGPSNDSNTATAIIVPVATTPAAPSNVRVSNVLTGGVYIVTLRWADNANNETGFNIQIATDASFTTGVINKQVGVNVTSFNLTKYPSGSVYYFRVQSYNDAGVSAWVNATPFPITTH